MATEERVILVDSQDRETGSAEKLAAHRSGELHRAFSVFVFDRQGRVLLQQRTQSKYHSRLKWSNTCCGHPRPGESVNDAARRRLREEMGFDCELKFALAFQYRAELEDGLVENEVDHVLIGHFDGTPRPDLEEVAAWRWANLTTVHADIEARPHDYSAWFTPALKRLEQSGYVEIGG